MTKHSHWNYRVIKHYYEDGSEYFGIHEVFYENDKPSLFNMETSTVIDDSIEELKGSLELMIQAFDKPVLEESDFEEQ